MAIQRQDARMQTTATRSTDIMLCNQITYSITLLLKLIIIVACWPRVTIMLATHQLLVANAETVPELAQEPLEQQQQQTLPVHPLLFVDTKYWTGDTEFGQRDNWLALMKPCTLLERIQINESAVVSMGDSLDALGGALESNIRELLLAQNGMLLLEEDTINDPIDSLFIQYLNESGDCVDSEQPLVSDQLEPKLGGSKAANKDRTPFQFQFQPDSDRMSWFNPANWQSELNEVEIDDWIPESHRIPCSEDVIVFGSRRFALNSTIESNERAKTLTFKVNFRASQAAEEGRPSDTHSDEYHQPIRINSIRVAKLKIGDQSYDQSEFQRLVSSEQYEDILFQFNDGESVLKPDDGFAYSASSLFTIDESSIRSHSSANYDLCLDEAGCLCGNENVNKMRAICSFNYPLQDHEQPCRDPIESNGYCNKICATILTIGMDPAKFSERFLATLLDRLLTESGFEGSVFTGARRISENKYEITFRHVPSDNEAISYDSTLGREREFAELVHQKLSNGATKSFYGIKSIVVESSINWRRNDQASIFWTSFIVSLVIVTSILSYQERSEMHDRVADTNRPNGQSLDTTIRLITNLLRFKGRLNQRSDETESFAQYSESMAINGSDNPIYGSATGIALEELDCSGGADDISIPEITSD